MPQMPSKGLLNYFAQIIVVADDRGSMRKANFVLEIRLIDAHAHLSADSLTCVVSEVIAHLLDQGLKHVALGGVDPPDWQRQLDLAQNYKGFLTTAAGIHPWVVRDFEKDTLDAMFLELQKLAPRFDLMGEVGFDFFQDNSPTQKMKQLYWVERQLELALRLNKPVVLHVVRGHDQMLKLLEKFDGLKGLTHAFSGGQELAREYNRRGFVLSLGRGFFTRKKKTELAWLKDVPFVLESDAPSYKSKETDPQKIAQAWIANLEESAKDASEALGISEHEIWSITEQHFAKLLSISRNSGRINLQNPN